MKPLVDLPCQARPPTKIATAQRHVTSKGGQKRNDANRCATMHRQSENLRCFSACCLHAHSTCQQDSDAGDQAAWRRGGGVNLVLDPNTCGARGARQGCIGREGTAEAAPEAVRWAVEGGCQSGWGRLLEWKCTRAPIDRSAVRLLASRPPAAPIDLSALLSL